MNTRQITGTPSEILVEQLVASGVKYVFYNSGSREALFFDALHGNPNIHGILALHEGSVTSMAGGYSQVHNDPAVMVVHLGAGLAQCMGQLINVWFGGLPVVVITFAGDTGSWVDRINLDLDHSFGPSSISAPMVKANWTVIDPEGLPSAVERALQVARTPPYGPVHLAVYDTMLGKQQITADIIEGSKSGLRSGNASDEDLVRVLGVLDESKKPMIYAGDGIWKSGGEKLAAQLATHFGAAVANSHTDYRGISIKHPQHIGQFDQASAAYEPDFILSIGARHQGSGYSSDHIPFKRLSNTGGTHIALGSDLEYVTNYPGLDLAIIGDEKNALERLLSVAMDDFPSTRYNLKREKALEAGTLWRSARRKSMRPDLENGVVRPGVVADVVDAELEAIGGGFVTNEQFAVSHESIPSGLGEKNNVYLRPPGGSEGWGVGAAIGAKLAAVDQPVVGFVGDGSLYYADSGIWTAVHHNIPVLYIITNNRAYGIVAGFFEEADGRMSDTGKYGGVVLEGMEPVKIAEAFGMEAESVDDESKVVDAVRRGLTIVNKENRPYLIEFKLPIGLPEGGVADQQYRMR